MPEEIKTIEDIVDEFNSRIKKATGIEDIDEPDDDTEEEERESTRNVEQIELNADSDEIEYEVDVPMKTFKFIEYVQDKLLDIYESGLDIDSKFSISDYLSEEEEKVITSELELYSEYEELSDRQGRPIYEETAYGDRVRSIKVLNAILIISPLNIELLFWKMIIYLEVLHDSSSDDNKIFPGVISYYLDSFHEVKTKKSPLLLSVIERRKQKYKKQSEKDEDEYIEIIPGVHQVREIAPEKDFNNLSQVIEMTWNIIRFCFEANKEFDLGLKIGKKINNQLDNWKKYGITPSGPAWKY